MCFVTVIRETSFVLEMRLSMSLSSVKCFLGFECKISAC